MTQEVDNPRHYKLRLYLAPCFGWPGALAFTAGLVMTVFDPRWGGRLLAFSCGLVAVANEIDPNYKNPWWWRAGLALIAAIGALYP
jgi:hypothetical protein